MELEKDLLSSREECIQLNEKINSLDAEVGLLFHNFFEFFCTNFTLLHFSGKCNIIS